MNILFCGNLDYSNNIAALTTVNHFKKSLEENSHNVYVFGSTQKKFLKPNLKNNESRISYAPPSFKRFVPKTFQIIENDRKKIKQYLPKVINSKSIEIIIVYSTFYPVLEEVIKVTKKYNLKCLTYGGEYFSINFKNLLNTTNIFQFLAKIYSYQKFDGHICSTHFHEKYLKRFSKKTIVIPTISPLTNQKNNELDYKWEKSFNLVWMGKPNHREFILRIIKGFKIAQKKDNNIKLFLISEIDSRKSSLCKKIINEINGSQNIFITGFLTETEKSNLLNKASAFIHLRNISRETFHAFPTRVPEYLAYKKPIIFSKCPPFTDYFVHLKDAFFINARNNIFDISDAIYKLYKNPKISKEISKNCSILIRNNFSIEINGTKLNKFIESFKA